VTRELRWTKAARFGLAAVLLAPLLWLTVAEVGSAQFRSRRPPEPEADEFADDIPPGPAGARVRERAGIGYNAVETREGTFLPVYPVRDARARVRGVAFRHEEGRLTAYDARSLRVLWSRRVGEGQLFGGFDFNRDGWIDLGLARTRETNETWGSQWVKVSWLDLVDGRTGDVYARVTPPARDKSWDFRTASDQGSTPENRERGKG